MFASRDLEGNSDLTHLLATQLSGNCGIPLRDRSINTEVNEECRNLTGAHECFAHFVDHLPIRPISGEECLESSAPIR